MMPGKIQFAESDGAYVLKLIGEVRLTLSSTLDSFLQGMFEEPCFRSVIVDLSEAETIDSTSLGLLAKLSIVAKEKIDQRPVLISPKPDITRILMSMGFERIFIIVADFKSDATEYQEIECDDCSKESIHALILDAHKTLMNINENNQKPFSDLVRQLEHCKKSELTDNH